MSVIRSIKKSLSRWEDSYFGGYGKVLRDHPEVFVPYQVHTELPKDCELSYYLGSKLMDIFLLKVVNNHFIEFIQRYATIEEESWFYQKKKFQVFNARQVEIVLNQIILSDTELGALFDHFKEVIKNTKFKVEIPEPQDGSPDEGDGDGKDDEEEKRTRKVIQGDVKEILQKIKEMRKAHSYLFNTVCDFDRKTTFKVMAKHPDNPVKYTQEEVVASDQLVRMLDINFEPKADRVNSLRAGKMDMNKLAEVPACNPNVYYKVEEEQATRPFSVCILCDESGSMHSDDLYLDQHSLVKVLYRAFAQILPAESIYIYGHSGHEEPEIRVYNEKYNPIFEECIQGQLSNEYMQNYDGPVIEEVYKRVRQQTDDNIIFISMSDGEPAGDRYGGDQAIKDMKRIIEKCKRDGFVTLGVGFDLNLVKHIYNYHCNVLPDESIAPKVAAAVNNVVRLEFKN